MKQYIIILAIFAIQLKALEFLSFQEALRLQQKNKKIIMIDAVREDCRYCKKMEKSVFSDKSMAEWLQKRFIPVKIDIEKESLPYGLKVHFTPTFIFIKEHKVLKIIPGSWNIRDFKDLTKDIK